MQKYDVEMKMCSAYMRQPRDIAAAAAGVCGRARVRGAHGAARLGAARAAAAARRRARRALLRRAAAARSRGRARARPLHVRAGPQAGPPRC